ncbi:MAG: VWA-like domain-containing protein [Eubacteriales bacterium]|nr:VWA-like domain-containing protein [Eubacteriales bacterium]
MRDGEKAEKTAALAEQILALSRDGILMQLRFLDVALSRLRTKAQPGLKGAALEGDCLYYDPVYVLRRYRDEAGYGARLYLHVLLHCIFFHSFRCDKTERRWWDLAADAAAENTILELGLDFAALRTDAEARDALERLKKRAGGATAERLYRFWRANPCSEEDYGELRRLFGRDSHELWGQQETEELFLTQEMWKRISQRVSADVKSFSAGRADSESIRANLSEAVRERCDYGELLRHFASSGEEMQLNDEEFDYVYYTYGLSHYGNLPLVEPLEYREVRKIREFVIALDTSASCRGEVIEGFLRRTWEVLCRSEHFFQKTNVHIVQCDSQVRQDVKITCREELEEYMAAGRLQGFGATDFRPVFEHVEELLDKGEFENLKGLVYFTDGFGIYPERMPPYQVIFAFLENGGEQPQVPPWAIRAVLEEDRITTGQEDAR